MPYPAGVQTVTLRLGSSFDSAGTLASVSGYVMPMMGGGADHLVWSATGQTYAKVRTALAWDAAEGVAYATVPHPTQAGWRDQTQAPFSGWSYQITAVAVYASGERHPFGRTVTPQPGDTVIDVDLLPDGVAATPTVVAEWEAARADALAALDATEVQQVTLTGSLAYTLPVGASPSRVHSVVFTQDGTGGHTVTYGGNPVTVALGAGAETLVELWPGGEVVYPGATGGAPALHTHALAGLTQSGATTGQVPTWDGTEWAPADPATGGAVTLDALTDVDTTGAATGKVLTFDEGTGQWIAALGTPGPAGDPGDMSAGDLTGSLVNLFDAAQPLTSGYIGQDGTTYTSTTYGYTAPITVTAGATYSLSSNLSSARDVAIFYNAANAVVGAVDAVTFTAPAGATYCRLNILLTVATWPTLVMVEGGTVPPAGIPYGTKLADDVFIAPTTLLATNRAYAYSTAAGRPTAVTGTGTGTALTTTISTPNTFLGTKEMYYSIKAKVDGTATALYIKRSSSGAPILQQIDNPVSGQEYLLSGQYAITLSSTAASRTVEVAAVFADTTAQTGAVLTASKGIAVSLTDDFGAGNEPRKQDMDLLMSQFTDRWFPGTSNLFGPRLLSMMGRELKPTFDGATNLQLGAHGAVTASSAVNPAWDQWALTQRGYGWLPTKAPVPHLFHGAIETDAMISVIAKYGRWSQGGHSVPHLLGGHVFEAWNNIGTYRLTMMVGSTREDEACLQVFSPDSAYANPMYVPTVEQEAARITQDGEDRFGPTAYFGRVRIGSDVSGQGTVFQKERLTVEPPTKFILKTPTNVPASATAAGDPGQITWDANYVYVCTATNTWKRTALSTW